LQFDDSYPKENQPIIKTIIVENVINAPIEKVWEMWTEPKHIVNWYYAIDDWEAPYAENNLLVGGKFKTVMSAKDKSSRFDFTGVYTNLKKHELIEFNIDDSRHVRIEFTKLQNGIKVTEIFEPEKVYSEELQRTGWQAILDNFKKYVENN